MLGLIWLSVFIEDLPGFLVAEAGFGPVDRGWLDGGTPKSCGQRLHGQVEIGDEWWSSGVGIGSQGLELDGF